MLRGCARECVCGIDPAVGVVGVGWVVLLGGVERVCERVCMRECARVCVDSVCDSRL